MDELNDLEITDALFDEYFEEMEISEKEKEDRADFSKKFHKMMLFIFSVIVVMKSYNYLRKRYIADRLSEEYRNILSQYIDIDDYLDNYINEFSDNTIDTTFKNIDDEFFLSEDRAFLISVNEANTGFNYNQFAEAVKSGKTRKQWITEKDRRVRRTHRELDDKSIPILALFKVGKTQMRFPHDTLYGLDYAELSNCRCSVKYY